MRQELPIQSGKTVLHWRRQLIAEHKTLFGDDGAAHSAASDFNSGIVD